MKRTNKYLISVLSIFAMVTTFSCNRNGDGEIISREMPAGNFNVLTVDGMFNVFLIQDTFCSVEFLGEKRNVDRCKAELLNGELVVSGSKRGEFLHPNEMVTEVYIHVDSLTRINVHEDCNIQTDQRPLAGHEIGMVVDTRFMEADIEVSTDIFYYWNNPNGSHLNLTGRTDELKIWNAGLGSVDATQLTADYILIDNGSQSDCKVRCVQRLEYSLTNTGNIIYFGNPADIVPNLTSGTGELLKGD